MESGTVYRRTKKEWIEPSVCGLWLDDTEEIDRDEEWQQLVCLVDQRVKKGHATHTRQELDAELQASLDFLAKGKYPKRTAALHLHMRQRLQALLDELVAEGYLSRDQ